MRRKLNKSIMSKITVSGIKKYLIDNSDWGNDELTCHTMGTSKEMNGIWKDIPLDKFVILAPNLHGALILVEEYLNKNYQASIFEFLVDIYGKIDDDEMKIYDFMFFDFCHRYDLWIHQDPLVRLTNKIIIK